MTKPLCFIDIETTGKAISSRVVALAAIKDGAADLSSLVKPPCPIPGDATAIHGITTEMVQGSPTFAEVAPTLLEFVAGATLVGYGLRDFDIPILAEECHRVGLVWPNLDSIDLLQAWRENEPRTLEAAARHFCGRALVNAHTALADATACVAILDAQRSRGFAFAPDDRVDPAGYLLRRDGVLCFRRGRNAGDPVAKHLGYVSWLLNNAPMTTRNVLLRNM